MSQQRCIVIFALVCCFAILVALIFSAVDIMGEDEDGLSEKNCQNNCRVALVENIPEGINYSDSAPSHLSLFQGWMNLLNMAEKSVDIVSSQWDLNHSHPSACQERMLINRQQQAREISQARISVPSDRKEIALGAISMPFGAFPASALYARKDLLQRPAHVATKTFQGLRIFVNDELHELFIGLQTAEKFLKPGGRLVALSFHSLEDRIIKRFLHGIDMTEKYNLGSRQKIRQALKNGSKEEDAQEFPHGKSNSRWIFIQKKVLTPQAKDIQTNPRGRSAKLRAAIKI